MKYLRKKHKAVPVKSTLDDCTIDDLCIYAIAGVKATISNGHVEKLESEEEE